MATNFPQGAEQFHGILGLPHTQDSEKKFDLPMEEQEPEVDINPEVETSTTKSNSGKIIRAVAPYAAIFIAGLFVYLFIFTRLSITSWFTTKPAIQNTNTQQVTLSSSQQSAYNAWIGSYFFDVSDTRVIAPNYDFSGSGLTNYQKFMLGLNPLKQDTIGLGISDSQALIAGIDPLTGNTTSNSEKTQTAKYVDLEALANQVALTSLNSSPKVAGAYISADGSQNAASINTNIAAHIDIPKLKISAPLIWSKDASSFDSDLQNGLIHYPGTALPGEVGTSYISGHSSNYIWAKGSYNQVFAHIANLKQDDSFSITATDTNGKQVIYHYIVTSSGIFKADDPAQFANIGKSTVALSTCWPIGTSSKRYVVFAQLSQIER